MTITFPRDLPSVLEVVDEDFTLVRDQNTNRRKGAKSQVSDRSDPYWSVEWTTTPIDKDEFQELEAWLMSFKGGMLDFLGYRVDRPYPKNYREGFDGLTRHGGGAFAGDAYVDAVTSTTITISGLPTTFALKAGDMVGLSEDGNRGLYQIMEDATASAGVVTVTVESFVLTTIFSAAAAAHFDRPPCLMKVVDWSGPRRPGLSAVKISAEQRIY